MDVLSACMLVYQMHAAVPKRQKRILEFLEWSSDTWLWAAMWVLELKPVPLGEQAVLLAPEPTYKFLT